MHFCVLPPIRESAFSIELGLVLWRVYICWLCVYLLSWAVNAFEAFHLVRLLPTCSMYLISRLIVVMTSLCWDDKFNRYVLSQKLHCSFLVKFHWIIGLAACKYFLGKYWMSFYLAIILCKVLLLAVVYRAWAIQYLMFLESFCNRMLRYTFS